MTTKLTYRRRSAVIAALMVIVGVTGCTSTNAVQQTESSGEAPGYVTAERRAVESVLVTEGTLVADARVAALAPADGDVEITAPTGEPFKPGETIAFVGGIPVRAAYEGRVDEVLVAKGRVLHNTPILAVTYAQWAVKMTVPPSDLYRLYAGPVVGTVNIDSGPSGLPCRIATPVDAAGASGSMLCIVETADTLAPGLPARVGLPTARREDVLTVPLTAVSGRVDSGVVSRVNPDGTIVRTDVKLGITDGVNIEVISGLEEGDSITAFPPGLR